MSSKIHLLSDHTINQIAAGEVVENPASVVKELVENAIDAGARKVQIETMAGGFQSIQISDDGRGMDREDALLSIQRHATSKIMSADDLFSLQTMGFRGEALASIAAISKITLTTAPADGETTRLEIEGGVITQVAPAARSQGTTVEVRSLFYNVPARKKFQKTASTSSAEITKGVTQLALAHPDVGFTLIQQHKEIFSFSPIDTLKRRAEVLLGKEWLATGFSIQSTDPGIQIEGWLASPLVSRPNRSGQHLVINRRPVSYPSIGYAIREAYATRLNADRHPVFLLHLTIDPTLVDVNVHPQKKEVRLHEESLLKFRLHKVVTEALVSGHTVPLEVYTPHASVTPFPFTDFTPFEERSVLREDPPERQEIFADAIKPIGLFGHYLLVDASTVSAKKGICFFDLPAIQASLWFEALMQPIADTSTSVAAQYLLFPKTLCFSKTESAALSELLPAMEKLGILMHQSAEGAFLVEALPPFLDQDQLESVLHEWIAQESNRSLQEERLSRLATSLIRHARRKARRYSLEEALRLVKENKTAFCPQGKATLYYLEEEELEKKFRSTLSSAD